MVAVDSVSKRAHFIPTTTILNSIGTAALYRDNIWKLHGLLDQFLSDRGTQFASEVIKELLKMLKIEQALTTAYYPQSDGQTE